MFNLNVSNDTKYIANVQIYTAANRKYQNKIPGACTVFAESSEELNTILMEIKVFTFTVMEITIIWNISVSCDI